MFGFLYDLIDTARDYFRDKLRQILIGVAPSVGLIIARGPTLEISGLYNTFYDPDGSDSDSVLSLEEQFVALGGNPLL